MTLAEYTQFYVKRWFFACNETRKQRLKGGSTLTTDGNESEKKQRFDLSPGSRVAGSIYYRSLTGFLSLEIQKWKCSYQLIWMISFLGFCYYVDNQTSNWLVTRTNKVWHEHCRNRLIAAKDYGAVIVKILSRSDMIDYFRTKYYRD